MERTTMKLVWGLTLLLGVGLIAGADAVLTLTSSPEPVQVCPNNLTITCNLTDLQDNSDVSSLISMVISRRDNVTQTVEDLVSIDAFSGGNLHTHPDLNGTVRGKLDQSGESYLVLQYLAPPPEAVGEYLCEAHAMDHFGHPIVLSSLAQVGEIKSSLSQHAPTGALADLLALKEKEKGLTGLNRDMFIESGRYQGHMYLLSKKSLSVDIAWVMCSLQGGYLAEIASKSEHEYVQTFLNQEMSQLSSSITNVLTGTVYNRTDFEFLRNAQDQVYLDWAPSQPSYGTKQYCVTLSQASQWKMDDKDCDSYRITFICEIP